MLPNLKELSDIRKYLLILETLELEKLNNVIVHKTSFEKQRDTTENLKSIKAHYKDLTHFLIQKQNDYRVNKFEVAFISEIESFVAFWEKTIANFKQVAKTEIEETIEKNAIFKKELYEFLEKVIGFRPPPNSLFLSLQYVRKLVAKLKKNDSIEYLNFEFYKKLNVKLNEDWVRDRRLTIISKMEKLERRLADVLKLLQDKLNYELQKLHAKRLKHFDRLMVYYTKVKNEISEHNSKEVYHFKKTQQFYFNRNVMTSYFHKNELFTKPKKNPLEADDDFEIDYMKNGDKKTNAKQTANQPKSIFSSKQNYNLFSEVEFKNELAGKGGRSENPLASALQKYNGIKPQKSDVLRQASSKPKKQVTLKDEGILANKQQRENVSAKPQKSVKF